MNLKNYREIIADKIRQFVFTLVPNEFSSFSALLTSLSSSAAPPPPTEDEVSVFCETEVKFNAWVKALSRLVGSKKLLGRSSTVSARIEG